MLPPEKTWQYLSAAQGEQKAVALLKQLRKCVACGELDVHHMICSQCRNVRYCEAACQLRHWQFPADQHKLHCCPRR
jgi:ribosomal protein L32